MTENDLVLAMVLGSCELWQKITFNHPNDFKVDDYQRDYIDLHFCWSVTPRQLLHCRLDTLMREYVYYFKREVKDIESLSRPFTYTCVLVEY